VILVFSVLYQQASCLLYYAMQHSMQQKMAAQQYLERDDARMHIRSKWLEGFDVDKEKEINVCCINNVANGIATVHKEGTVL
jgi:hypothetical protein